MTPEKPTVEKKWSKPTPKQRLSHRSILRFVELADQLARDLCTILLPDCERLWEQNQDAPAPLGVYFVSVDRHSPLEPRSAENPTPVRYYNLRLLKTFRLTDDPDEEFRIKPVWDWIKDKKNYPAFQPLFQCADFLEEHSRDHYKLFEQCIEEANTLDALPALDAQDDRDSLGKQEKDIAERVHDLLVEAIAAMPYTGLLPSALDRWFYTDKWRLKTAEPVLFSLKFGDPQEPHDGKVIFSYSKNWFGRYSSKVIPLRKQETGLIPSEAFGKMPKNAAKKAAELLGGLYIKTFINWFTLGATPSVPTEKSDGSPYDQASKDIEGFALPIHHFFDRAGNQVGGFEGWVVVYDERIGNASYKRAFTKARRNKKAVTLALRSFSRRIREERLRELIEKEWLTTSDCHSFTLHHFQEFDGWIPEKREDFGLPCREEHWQFAFLAGKEEVFEEGKAPRIRFTLYDKLGPSSTREHDPRKITHIAVCPPFHRGGTSEPEKPLLFRRREDTILPEDHHDLVDYGFHITQAVGQIYNAARLKEKAAQEANLQGRVSVSHSLQFTVSVQLEKLTDIAQDVRRLQTSPELFPIESFTKLPDAIRRFKYPVDLYAVAIENAIEQYKGSEGFSRLVPVVDWIDDAIETSGFNEHHIRKLAQEIAIPLARISLGRDIAGREPNARLSVSGFLRCDQLTPNQLQEGRILTATLIELLREAFHHAQGFEPKVEVVLIGEQGICITVANSCSSDVDIEKLVEGNQRTILERFAKHLHTWEIAPPFIDENKRWVRKLERRIS